MSRVVKKPEERRKEILDVVQQLIYSIGYEQMTIQDVLDKANLSRGALYYYFDSKQALLEGLIERTSEQGLQIMQPVLTDPKLNALQKLKAEFDSALGWKTAQKDALIPLIKVWLSDENALLREKELDSGRKILVPLLSEVLKQGIEEGTLRMPHPEQMARVLFALLLSFSEAIGKLILSAQPGSGTMTTLEATVSAYNYAIEQILGAEAGSLQLIELEHSKNGSINFKFRGRKDVKGLARQQQPRKNNGRKQNDVAGSRACVYTREAVPV